MLAYKSKSRPCFSPSASLTRVTKHPSTFLSITTYLPILEWREQPSYKSHPPDSFSSDPLDPRPNQRVHTLSHALHIILNNLPPSTTHHIPVLTKLLFHNSTHSIPHNQLPSPKSELTPSPNPQSKPQSKASIKTPIKPPIKSPPNPPNPPPQNPNPKSQLT